MIQLLPAEKFKKLANGLRLQLFAQIALHQFIDKPFEKRNHWKPENIKLSLFMQVEDESKSKIHIFTTPQTRIINKTYFFEYRLGQQ